MKSEKAISEALRMLDVFASVGATRFDITHTDIDGEKRGFRRGYALNDTKNLIPILIPRLDRRPE